MAHDHEAELRVALAEGIVSRAEAAALGAEAEAQGRSPLQLLRDRERISAETLAALQEAAGPRDPPGEAVESTMLAPPRDVAADPGATAGPAQAEPPPGEPEFPIPGWDRYQPIRFLGQGGMGKVFLARDLRLRRKVAIKFVRSDDRSTSARLLAEARAQARVDHPRVCKVFEVGEAQGVVYIAMQFIDGVPLGALAAELSVEQKAMILREAALGLHEAHRAGIIHRDVKPGNIMVERAEDGRLEPYVMDFGIARTVSEGTTETGTVLGTPHYMAPEQAHGEVHRLDRRADVYSLGATLYFLLTGRTVVSGDSPLLVLINVATAEPVAPRAIDPDLPADLEAIALRCLEKDRSARYDSARALAEDLDRFLRGDPVEARPTGAWYRLRKRLAKHRRLVIAASVAAALLFSALGWGISVRREAAARERLARRFTELVERIESQARYSALSRLHDVRGDHAALRARIGELEAEIRRAGPVAVGPGHYAMGRGHLALGEEARARELLESAWQRGYREPRAAYALALALGHLYAAELRDVERIEQKDRRAERRREVERRLRDPALAYLKQSEGAEVPSAAYVAALMAFYEGRLDDALRELDGVGGGLPWFWEAPALRGDVLQARAARRWNEGGDREGALADFEAGRRAYAEAAAVGESVAGVHESAAQLESAAMVMELYGRGEVKPRFERGLAAVQRALAVRPDNAGARLLEARMSRRFAEHVADEGRDAEELLTRSIIAAESALAVAPVGPAARMELGRSHYQLAAYLQDRNRDPGPELQKASEILAGVAPGDRDYDHPLYLGLIHQVWADHEDQAGKDPLSHRAEAIEALRAATRLDDRQVPAWINLGTNHLQRAASPKDPDPDDDLQRAWDAFEKARTLNPKHVVPYFFEGEVRRTLGLRRRARGGDAGLDLEASLAAYRQGITVNPKMWHLHAGAGLTLAELAREAWDHGRSPGGLLEEALGAHRRAIEVAPEQGLAHNNLGDALLLRALIERARGEDPSAAALAAMAAFEEALKRAPDHATLWTNLGATHVVLAERALEQKRDPRKHLAAAAAAVAKALERNPAEARAFRFRGEVRGIEARARGHRASAADFEAAVADLERATQLAPDDQETPVALGHLLGAFAGWQQAEKQSPGATLDRGVHLATQVLAKRPDWPDARLLRGSLSLARSRAPGGTKEVAARAAEDLARAIEINPGLAAVWAKQAELTRQMAAASR